MKLDIFIYMGPQADFGIEDYTEVLRNVWVKLAVRQLLTPLVTTEGL